jgi:hypothetical protein
VATHLTYYLSCYTTNRRAEMPWLYDYIDTAMRYWMAQVRGEAVFSVFLHWHVLSL